MISLQFLNLKVCRHFYTGKYLEKFQTGRIMNYIPPVEIVLVLVMDPFLNFHPLLKPKEQHVPGQIF